MNDDLTFEDVQAFIADRGGANPCEACGTQDWIVSLSFGDKGHMPIIASIDPAALSLFGAAMLPVVALSCKHCGNIRLLSRPTIARWKSEKANG
ncbi:hypothetical protein FHS82_001014 [Pseudochelatococcus lubricantis]|uniref:Uncharacterized protein n=1 Tax=Pseudochelatococcus lubricantis TaxID=1538102 RepID=A0ABX0UW67_9HYPH|nr:hypothetical protein [Pseudochelatococcus lubricantis]NIJ57188.1 hypothetical protein [Pseudochelatococcus lubricantis]